MEWLEQPIINIQIGRISAQSRYFWDFLDLRKKLLVISLEALDHFFEDMSFMDSELCCDIEKERRKRDDCFDKCYARVLPGVEDTVDTKPVEFTWKTRTTLNDMRGAMEVASLEGSHKHFHHSIQEAVQDFEADSTSLISDSCDCNLLPSLCPHWRLRSSISGSEMGRYKALMLGRGNITGEWKAVWLSCTMPSDPVHSRNCAASSSLRLSTSIEGLTRYSLLFLESFSKI